MKPALRPAFWRGFWDGLALMPLWRFCAGAGTMVKVSRGTDQRKPAMPAPNLPESVRLAQLLNVKQSPPEVRKAAVELLRQREYIIELLAQQTALEHEVAILKASGKRRQSTQGKS